MFKVLSGRRRGHSHGGCLAMLALLTCMYCLAMGLISHWRFKSEISDAPGWFQAVYWICSPAALIIGLMIVVYVPMLIEEMASVAGVAVWQYPKRAVLGMPKWLADRLMILALAAAGTLLTLLAVYGSFGRISHLSFWQWNCAGLWAMGYATLVTFILAWLRWRKVGLRATAIFRIRSERRWAEFLTRRQHRFASPIYRDEDPE